MRRLAISSAVILSAGGVAASAYAAAEGTRDPGHGRILIHRAGISGPQAAAFWTPQRRRRAAGVEPPQLRGRPRGFAGGKSSGASASTAPDGADTVNSTVYPNSANGVVFGRYLIGSESELYRCSGSVINSAEADLVMTSGHCVIDPDSGALATDLVFVPGFRNKAEPFGEWPATSFATTAEWEGSAGTGSPDEAGDVAFLRIDDRPLDSASVQSVVGALGIDFNRARHQTYTQYGYPAESPYDGSKLFRISSSFAGSDSAFSPSTIAIASDFTPGSSGGPWTVGGFAPVALSLTDYSYSSLDGFLFGPYFGAAVQNLYKSVGGSPAGAPAAPTSNAEKPSNAFNLGRVVRDRSNGTAELSVGIPGPGRLVIEGVGVRRRSKTPGTAGSFELPIRPTGARRARLRRSVTGVVRTEITFTPTGGDASRRTRVITLVLRP